MTNKQITTKSSIECKRKIYLAQIHQCLSLFSENITTNEKRAYRKQKSSLPFRSRVHRYPKVSRMNYYLQFLHVSTSSAIHFLLRTSWKPVIEQYSLYMDGRQYESRPSSHSLNILISLPRSTWMNVRRFLHKINCLKWLHNHTDFSQQRNRK